MPDEVKIAKIAGEIAVVEARLIAARHLRLTDRVRLLDIKKRRLGGVSPVPGINPGTHRIGSGIVSGSLDPRRLRPTATGTGLLVVVPSPCCPSSFCPQH